MFVANCSEEDSESIEVSLEMGTHVSFSVGDNADNKQVILSMDDTKRLIEYLTRVVG